MKIISAFASLLFLTGFSFSVMLPRANNVATGNQLSPSSCCGNSSQAVPLLRAYNPSITAHFYTTSAAEMQNAIQNLGYSYEGITGSIFLSQVFPTFPYYRLYNPTILDHFYTTDPIEQAAAVASLGYVEIETTGYVYASQICGAGPLYRLYSPSATDHFYTMSASEMDNAVANLGYNFEGIQAYILPN